MASAQRQRIGLLASVRSLEEAELAAAAGVDLIDLKEPSRGALGMVLPETLRAVVRLVGGNRPVSATIGDTPPDPEAVRHRVRTVAACGPDFVKVGVVPGVAGGRTFDALAPLTADIRLVAVLLADVAFPDADTVRRAAAAGLAGVMLDTRDKTAGSLAIQFPLPRLAEFVASAREFGLLVGLAGSLALDDIPLLAPLGPDYLGFRGGLCDGGRETALVPERVVEALERLQAAEEIES